jgi:aminoglycoside phosphotransferase (APT) family kinase protein
MGGARRHVDWIRPPPHDMRVWLERKYALVCRACARRAQHPRTPIRDASTEQEEDVLRRASPGADFEISPRLARDLITQQFPALHPQTVERFGRGMDNVAYAVDHRYIFRFPRRAIAAPLLEIEIQVLPLIAQRVDVPIPVPRFVGTPDLGYPWAFGGYERLRGSPAGRRAPTPQDHQALARALGSFLRDLHSMDPTEAVNRGLVPDQLGRLDHAKRLPMAGERFAELEAAGMVCNSEPFISFMIESAPGELGEPSSIVHGDLYASHLLLDDQGHLAGIIDWGDVHLGHPAVDLMIAHTLLPRTAHAEFLKAYGGTDPRTWQTAKYRAVYHSALVAHYGMSIGDEELRDTGLHSLSLIRGTLDSP